MIAPVFKDQHLEDEINENGYVVVPGFLSGEEVASLLSVYRKYHTERSQGCWNSHIDLSVDAGAEISDKIRELVTPGLDKLFVDWAFPYAQLIVKNPGQRHDCLIHRDDSIFDENQIQYRQLWMPLVDLTADNGALYIVPKSHKLFTDSKPMFTKWPYAHLIPRLEQEFVTLYAKAGDMIIWVEKTLHGSYENISEETRPVFQGGVIHKDTKPLFPRYRPERNEVDVYQVDPAFFANKEYVHEQVDPRYPLLRVEPYTPTQITEADIDRFFAGQKAKNN